MGASVCACLPICLCFVCMCDVCMHVHVYIYVFIHDLTYIYTHVCTRIKQLIEFRRKFCRHDPLLPEMIFHEKRGKNCEKGTPGLKERNLLFPF